MNEPEKQAKTSALEIRCAVCLCFRGAYRSCSTIGLMIGPDYPHSANVIGCPARQSAAQILDRGAGRNCGNMVVFLAARIRPDCPISTKPYGRSSRGNRSRRRRKHSISRRFRRARSIRSLTGLLGANIEITLEIGVEIPGGAADNVVRTVTENCRTLKFESSGFEEN